MGTDVDEFRRAECVPADQDRARLLRFEQAQQEIGETDDRAAAFVARTQYFGNAWYARCANELPSTTSKGLFMAWRSSPVALKFDIPYLVFPISSSLSRHSQSRHSRCSSNEVKQDVPCPWVPAPAFARAGFARE